ncbi:unnamed protein product [Wuchereria bancrofti]|uniref:Uncharacterized protein n=1 Tax=Wuchereria bancrofti TaxID=6293 RepID=A0A3P7EZZ9_WUCBA|nr:unnamed protein product [Wuchereria bancrofti]
MFDTLLKGAEMPKSKIQKLLSEVNEFDLTQPERTFPRELKQQYEAKLRIIKEMTKRLIMLKWSDLIQNTTNSSQRRDEEKKYLKTVDDPQSILNLIANAREAIIKHFSSGL